MQTSADIQKKIDDLERLIIELQDALQREQKDNSLKSQFIGTAAHEFRTPLTTILNSADFLGMVGRSCDEEKYREHIAKIQRAVNYLAEFSEDVLTISKFESSNSFVKPVHFLIDEFCQNLIDEISDTQDKSHRIKLFFSGITTALYHDKHLLQHIILNLLENSIKYSLPETPIELYAAVTPTHLELRVQDQGRGILEEDKQRLFEPFERGSNNYDTMGTGLGLSIVKKSVDILNGTINVKSELNIGTMVIVTIPLLENTARQ